MENIPIDEIKICIINFSSVTGMLYKNNSANKYITTMNIRGDMNTIAIAF